VKYEAIAPAEPARRHESAALRAPLLTPGLAALQKNSCLRQTPLPITRLTPPPGPSCGPTTGNQVFASPTVANRVVYVGSGDGNMYAFGL
jgi:hypothetical protein